MAFYLSLETGFWIVRSTLLDGLPFRHGFSTRRQEDGGELDLRIRKDGPEPGLRSRRSFFSRVLPPGGQVILPHQVHSDTVLEAAEGVFPIPPPEGFHPSPLVRGDADGVLSASERLAAGIQTADCVPVLLADPDKKVCAAVHSGWKGTLAGIAGKAVRLMGRRFGCRAESIRAAIGPSIGRCCYEVDTVLGQRFEEAFPGSVHGWTAGGKCTLDLRFCIRETLAHEGLRPARIDAAHTCTRCRPHLFHSYRRTGPPTGRMVSFILPKVEHQ